VSEREKKEKLREREGVCERERERNKERETKRERGREKKRFVYECVLPHIWNDILDGCV